MRPPRAFTLRMPLQFHRPEAEQKPSETNAELQRSLARTPGAEVQNAVTTNICHFKTGPRSYCHILKWLLDFVMSKTTPLAAPKKSSIFAHLCRSPQVTDSVSDTIPLAEVRATKGRARVDGSRRLHDSAVN